MPVELKSGILIWNHGGGEREPYARLSDSEPPIITNSFANCTPLITQPAKLRHVLRDLVGKYIAPRKDHVVVAHAPRSTTIGSHLAEILEARFWWVINASNANVRVHPDITVDQVREAIIALDIVSSGEKLRQMKDAMRRLGVPLAPFMYCLVNRSQETLIDGIEIRAMLHQPMTSWKFGENPITRGDEVVSPRDPRLEWGMLVQGGQ